MVKIEIISPGASASILRNGARMQVFEKQLISYAEADTLEVTGGDVTYSVNESEVITKSGNTTPVVPQAAEPQTTDAVTATKGPSPVIVRTAAKTASASK